MLQFENKEELPAPRIHNSSQLIFLLLIWNLDLK